MAAGVTWDGWLTYNDEIVKMSDDSEDLQRPQSASILFYERQVDPAVPHKGSSPAHLPPRLRQLAPKNLVSNTKFISCILVNLYSNHLCLFGIKLWRKFLNYE